MTTIFLIRHGLTALTGTRLYGRAPGIDLDERGRAQAERLVDRFAGVRLTALYSSPLERCRQTVAPLAAAQRLEMRVSGALEEMDAGRWTNRRLSSLRSTALWRTVQDRPSEFRFPGGESFLEAEQRLVGEIDRIARRHPRGRVAIASHGDMVKIAIAHYLGSGLDRFQRLAADVASVSVIHLSPRGGHVLAVNDTGDALARFGPRPKTSRRANLRG